MKMAEREPCGFLEGRVLFKGKIYSKTRRSSFFLEKREYWMKQPS